MLANNPSNDTGKAAYQATAAPADVGPLLDSIIFIVGTVEVNLSPALQLLIRTDFASQGFCDHKAEWKKFSCYMQRVGRSVVDAYGLTQSPGSIRPLEGQLNELKRQAAIFIVWHGMV